MYLRWSITQNREQNIIKKIILKPALVSQLVRNLEHLFLSFLNFGSFHRVFPEKDNDRRPSVKFFPLQNAFLRQNYFYAQKLFDIKTFLRRKSSFGVRMLSWPVYFIKILSKNAGIIDIFYFFSNRYIYTVETHKSLHHKSLRNFKSLRFFGDFLWFSKNT